MVVKIRLKGHESFSLREGWLRKGLVAITENNMNISLEDEKARDIFTSEHAIDVLGVGSNMVKSIKYWLQACGLSEERRTKKGRRISALSSEFGKIINKHDPYFEEIFTLWLLHYKLVTNIENATSWYLFFNDFNANEFSKEDLFKGLDISMARLNPELSYSEKSLYDDCSCIIRTYYTNNDALKSPEENLNCPLAELDLLGRKITLDKKEVYIKKKPRVDILDSMVILYVIVDKLKGEMNTTLDRLLNEEGNIGKVFNLDRILVNYYLDQLEKEGYLIVNRTAGLDAVYLKKEIGCVDLLNYYYKQLRRES